MTSPPEFTAATDAVVQFITENGLKFERGDPKRFFTTMSQVNAGLTLPIVQEHLSTLIELKNFYSLWNFLVDDEIDRERRSEHLDTSILVLLHHSRGESGPAPTRSSSVAKALDIILSRLPTSPDKAQYREMLYFDLWTLICGFKYEWCINQNPAVANSLEYRKYTTLVGSVLQYLDLDCLFATHPPSAAAYRKLREAYDHLGRALKFSSDIGSLKREVMNEGQNLNLGLVRAAEAGLAIGETPGEGEQKFEAIRSKLHLILEGVRKEATGYLASAQKPLDSISGEVNSQRLMMTVTAMVEQYFKHDVFFSK